MAAQKAAFLLRNGNTSGILGPLQFKAEHMSTWRNW